MSRFLVFLLTVLIGGLLLVSCSKEKKAEVQPQKQMEQSTEKTLSVTPDMLATEKDPVCGMDLKAGSIADTAIYNGKLYGFCSEECKSEFKADPQKYLAKLSEQPGKEGKEAGTEEHPH